MLVIKQDILSFPLVRCRITCLIVVEVAWGTAGSRTPPCRSLLVLFSAIDISFSILIQVRVPVCTNRTGRVTYRGDGEARVCGACSIRQMIGVAAILAWKQVSFSAVAKVPNISNVVNIRGEVLGFRKFKDFGPDVALADKLLRRQVGILYQKIEAGCNGYPATRRRRAIVVPILVVPVIYLALVGPHAL